MIQILVAGALVLSVLALHRPASAEAPPVRMLDTFDDISSWRAGASDDVRAAVHAAADGVGGRSLRLDFDLAGTAGYALARRALSIDLPRDWEIVFYLRGDAPPNQFQLKLVDASGDNVWWVNRPDFEFSRDWQLVRIKKRHVEFAWGPTTDRTLRHVAAIELVVAAGRGGGHGSVQISQLALRELPDAAGVAPPPIVSASSSLPGADPALALDGSATTAWQSDPAAGRAQHLTLDFQRPREFGGLTLRWLAGAHASRYDVQFSDDGLRWRTVRRVVAGRGGPDALLLPESETRFLRLVLHDGPGRGYGLTQVDIRDLAFGASPNAFFQALARESPRGTYPRGMSGEQTAWTIVGIDGGGDSALLSADGALEVGKGAFSIEPLVVADGRLTSWADVEAQPSLLDDYLPIPEVTWRDRPWQLSVSAFASGSRDESRVIVRYTVRNLSARPLPLELVLAVRPFQVNPPSQSLNLVGGATAIRDIRWDGSALSVNTDRTVFPLSAPDRVGAFAFDAGPITRLVGAADWTGARELHDEAGYASAALGYRLALAPHGTATVGVVLPLSGVAHRPPNLDGLSVAAWLDREQGAVAAAWRERLNRVAIDVPAQGRALVAALRTALAHILITRDGPALRPGTRSYARSWIRDGAMIGESLLRLGHADVATDYLRWYAQYQFANGKVPCCVDARGADAVAEHDSAGELIFLAAEIDRYARDRALLESMWPHVDAAARYLEQLRQSERTEANLTPATRAFYGLVPASISHEGYSAKPMHSYWDDFWALKGYSGAVAIASALGHADAAARLTRERDEFRTDLAASLRHAVAARGVAYLPGAAELGDFDPTSSTIAIAPAGELHRLPAELVRATYERYWREFVDRRAGRIDWDDYTPYEVRTVGTFVRLGWRARAHELLAFFLDGRRPAAWNQWPEVVGRDPKQPRFVGDLPHGWVASDFIRAVLDLFAYEREADQSIVLGAGVPPEWLDAPGVAVKDLRTPYGVLSYSVGREGGAVVLQVDGSGMPPGGFVFAWPGGQTSSRDVTINGAPAPWHGTEVRVDTLPARVVIR
jgi:hypothetical protein